MLAPLTHNHIPDTKLQFDLIKKCILKGLKTWWNLSFGATAGVKCAWHLDGKVSSDVGCCDIFHWCKNNIMFSCEECWRWSIDWCTVCIIPLFSCSAQEDHLKRAWYTPGHGNNQLLMWFCITLGVCIHICVDAFTNFWHGQIYMSCRPSEMWNYH